MAQSLKEYVTSVGYWGLLIFANNATGVTGAILDISDWGTFPTGLWVALLIIGFVIVPFIAFHRVRVQRDKLVSSQPNLELWGTPYVDERIIYETAVLDGERKVIGKPYFAHVRFCNNPLVRSIESAAKQVVAEVDYFDKESNHVLGTIYGRWGDTTQPSYLPKSISTRDILGVDFEPNGLPRELDIALKHMGDEECYAYNNDSYHSTGWKLSQFILLGEIFKVRVKLKGVGVDKEWWFQLQNEGKDCSLGIEIIQQ